MGGSSSRGLSRGHDPTPDLARRWGHGHRRQIPPWGLTIGRWDLVASPTPTNVYRSPCMAHREGVGDLSTGVWPPFGLQEGGEAVVYSHLYGHAVRRRWKADIVLALSLGPEEEGVAATVDSCHDDLGHSHLIDGTSETASARADAGETQVIENAGPDRTEDYADDGNYFLRLQNSQAVPRSTGVVSRMNPVYSLGKLAEQYDWAEGANLHSTAAHLGGAEKHWHGTGMVATRLNVHCVSEAAEGSRNVKSPESPALPADHRRRLRLPNLPQREIRARWTAPEAQPWLPE